MQWLKEGDQNTKFFHRMTSVRRSTNHIHYLRVGESVVESVDDMHSHIDGYFRTLYRDGRPQRPKLDGMQFPLLGDGQAEWLERPFVMVSGWR